MSVVKSSGRIRRRVSSGPNRYQRSLRYSPYCWAQEAGLDVCSDCRMASACVQATIRKAWESWWARGGCREKGCRVERREIKANQVSHLIMTTSYLTPKPKRATASGCTTQPREGGTTTATNARAIDAATLRRTLLARHRGIVGCAMSTRPTPGTLIAWSFPFICAQKQGEIATATMAVHAIAPFPYLVQSRHSTHLYKWPV